MSPIRTGQDLSHSFVFAGRNRYARSSADTRSLVPMEPSAARLHPSLSATTMRSGFGHLAECHGRRMPYLFGRELSDGRGASIAGGSKVRHTPPLAQSGSRHGPRREAACQSPLGAPYAQLHQVRLRARATAQIGRRAIERSFCTEPLPDTRGAVDPVLSLLRPTEGGPCINPRIRRAHFPSSSCRSRHQACHCLLQSRTCPGASRMQSIPRRARQTVQSLERECLVGSVLSCQWKRSFASTSTGAFTQFVARRLAFVDRTQQARFPGQVVFVVEVPHVCQQVREPSGHTATIPGSPHTQPGCGVFWQ